MNQRVIVRSGARGAAVVAALLMGSLAVVGTAGAHSSTSHPPRGDKLDKAAPTVSSTQLPRVGGELTIIKVFSWNIPAAHYVLMPEYSCPSDTPYFKSNGIEHKEAVSPSDPGGRLHYQGYEADFRAQASDGVGYKAGLHYLKLRAVNVRAKADDGATGDPRVAPQYTDVVVPTGFDKGTWASNSIWAPVFKGGTFKLTVTCTSSLANAAFASSVSKEGIMIPWLWS